MSKSGKIISWVIVAAVVVAGIWYFTRGGTALAPAVNEGSNQTASTTSEGDQSTAAAILSTKDNSDASLSTDLLLVDDQLTAIGTDSAAVDKDLNDKPISQE